MARQASAARAAKPAAVDMATIMQTTEFQEAVAKAVNDATASILAQLEAGRAKAGTVSEPGDQSLARTLAVEIARVADQGSNKKRLAPEEMERREDGFDRMKTLIVEFRARGIRPKYALKREVYLDEVFVRPTWVDPNTHKHMRTEIEWPNVPNHAMEPINDAAEEIFGAWMQSVGEEPRVLESATQSGGDLRVSSGPQSQRDKAPVGNGQAAASDLRILGRHQKGEIRETRVLGTLADPARQVG